MNIPIFEKGMQEPLNGTSETVQEKNFDGKSPTVPISSNGASGITGSTKITVYTTESPLRHPARLLADMFRDLMASRELAWRLFVRDLSAMYRQSVLGYLWALLPPIVTTLTFIYLSSQNILNVGETPLPYPAFVMIGTLLWQIFLDSLNTPLKAVQGAKSMLTKINFPREALIMGGMANVIFNSLIRLVLLIPVFIYFHLPLSGSLLLGLVGIMALMLLGLAFGMLITPIGLLYADVGHSISLITGFWMLLTPVVYPPARAGIGAWLAKWNPVSPVLLTCREWLTAQSLTHLDGFILISLGAVFVLLFSCILFRLGMPILIERMGG